MCRETHRWNQWEVLKQAMLYHGDITPFLHENEPAPASRGKLLAPLGDPIRSALLQIELAVVSDVGEHLVKATYLLEGDSPLVFSCLEIPSAVDTSIHTAHLPNTEAVICLLSAGNIAATQEWLKKCVEHNIYMYNVSHFRP